MTASAPVQQPPAPVRTSFLLWIVNVVLSLVSVVLLVIGGEELMLGGQQLDPEFQSAAKVGLIVGVVFVLVLVALEVFFAVKMRAGRNWARIVLAVLGGLALLLGAISLGDSVAMLSAGALSAGVGAISLIGVPLTAAGIVYMYLPGARDWFAPRLPAGPPPGGPPPAGLPPTV